MDRSAAEQGAEELLHKANILDEAADEMTRLGLRGEKTNRRLVFLAAVGGHVGEPIHLVIHGDSAGGKNTLVNTALQLLPQDRVRAFTGLSRHSLAYMGERVEGVLFIDEAEGQQQAQYAIRQAMSEGRITRLTVQQNHAGRHESEELNVEVDASIITTTTSPALHAENQTRVFDLWIDDSEDLTREVLQAYAKQAAGEEVAHSEAGRDVWREALSMLKDRDVVIPFAPALQDAFPTKPLRVRRDFRRMLRLVRVHALLHQRQRDRDRADRIVATPEDYGAVRPLLVEVLKPTVSGLTPKALDLCDLHMEMAKEHGPWVRRVDLEGKAKEEGVASHNTVRKWAQRLSSLGIWEGRRGQHRAWEHRQIRDPRSEPIPLPTAADLTNEPPTTPQSDVGRPTVQPDAISEQATKGPSEEGRASDVEDSLLQESLPWEAWEGGETPHDAAENGSHPPTGRAWEDLLDEAVDSSGRSDDRHTSDMHKRRQESL